MGTLEVIAHMRIRPGHVEGFREQAAELLRLSREQDTQTLRYDWFIDEERLECEVHEAYTGEQGLFEHNEHVMEARGVLFRTHADDHRMTVFGEISPALRELFARHAGGVGIYTRFGGC